MSTNPLASLFGSNPFKSLQEHMKAVIEAVDEVPKLFETIISGDREATVAVQERIFASEAKADDVKNELRLNLPRGLFMPVNRRDLLEILDSQDSIADVAQDIAGLLIERPMTIPDPLAADLAKFAERCVSVCHDAARVIEQLDELLETGFRGKEASHVEELIGMVNRNESVTDQMGIDIARRLFELEPELGAVDVMFLYRLIEWIGDMADYAEKVANRLRLLIAR